MTRYAITRALAWSFAILALAGMAIAQQTTQIERGEVVYVNGNDFVVKMENGEVRHFTAPPGATAMVDGKQITVADLKPGMKLQRTTTTTTVNRTVRSVRTVQGTVWQVNAPYVIFTNAADGKNRQVKVPDGTKFTIGGEQKTVFDLKKGMKFTATVVTEAPETVVSQQRSVTGAGAPPPPPAPIAYIPPPKPEAPLVIEEPAPAKPVAQAEAAPAPAPAAEPAKLPKTGTPLPLIGLLGFGMSAAGIAMRLFRR